MIPIKGYFYGGLIATIVIATGIFLNRWHYARIADLQRSQAKMLKTIKSKDLVINNLSVQIQEIVENNKVVGFEEFFNGLAENNITISNKLIF